MSHENTQKHTKKILPINIKSNKNNFCVILCNFVANPSSFYYAETGPSPFHLSLRYAMPRQDTLARLRKTSAFAAIRRDKTAQQSGRGHQERNFIKEDSAFK